MKSNSTATKSLTLALTPSIKLRENQAKLYEFIVGKHKAGGTINLQEVVDQYSEYGNRNIYNDEPHSYVYDYANHKDNLLPLRGDELRSYAVQWFIRNLGVFVVKGLLTAIPTMELSDVQIVYEVTELKPSDPEAKSRSSKSQSIATLKKGSE